MLGKRLDFVHTMYEIYEDQSSEAVLLVDGSNAFHSINRNAFLHNIIILCPPLQGMFEIVVMLTLDYFFIGGSEIQSMEGTTQSDPTAMAIYAIAPPRWNPPCRGEGAYHQEVIHQRASTGRARRSVATSSDKD